MGKASECPWDSRSITSSSDSFSIRTTGMPNVEVAGSGTAGWLCTIQPLSANGMSGLFRSVCRAPRPDVPERYENHTAGLVSVFDPPTNRPRHISKRNVKIEYEPY